MRPSEGGLGDGSTAKFCSHISAVAVEFYWAKDAAGRWQPQWAPVGQGMVKFPQFFKMLTAAGFSGPLQLHFEYPLGGAQEGKPVISIPQDEVAAAMKRDLQEVRTFIRTAAPNA
jgi:sugar phosphate isomerase/epimerase